MKKQIIILIIIGLVVVGGGILLLTLANPETSRNGDSSQVVDSALLVKGDSHMTGQTNAKVTFVEFGDYQCPACALVAPMIKNVLSEYKDNKDVNFVYRHYPLPQHTNAVPAAMAAEAAGEQGKYWEMHDRLYENQKDWERLANPLDKFTEFATNIGLDVNKFRESYSSGKYTGFINSDKQDGDALSLSGTPSLFLNGKQLDDIPSEQQLKDMIDEALKN